MAFPCLPPTSDLSLSSADVLRMVDRRSSQGGSPWTRSIRRSKALKVTRACDACKTLKVRCSGNIPCDRCIRKGRRSQCQYEAEYRRGKPVVPCRRPTQPNAPAESLGSEPGLSDGGLTGNFPGIIQARHVSHHDAGADSPASPELAVSGTQGQYYDTISGLTFLHRAVACLSDGQESGNTSETPRNDSGDRDTEDSPTLTVGDKPMVAPTYGHVHWPSKDRVSHLLGLYSDVCIASYRFLHFPTVESWADAMARNDLEGRSIFHGIGRARASIVLVVMAIATSHEDKASGQFREDEPAAINRADRLFSAAGVLLVEETASPTVESAQARILQVLYLLTTSRMNQAWYVFGTALQLISALGLHRKARQRLGCGTSVNFIEAQCRIRTFWTAYILDKYMGVIFGRPRHYHDDDIDQDLPASIDDEDMTPAGPRPRTVHRVKDCHLDALVFHARLALLLSEGTRTVYTIRDIPHEERIAAANRVTEAVGRWHATLPPYLGGAVQPSSLVPSFRRQAIVLRIAHAHAVMHVNRLFLLGPDSHDSGAHCEPQIRAALVAAQSALETVDDMAAEGSVFHAFWWTHYVAFCALAIVYTWEVRCRPGHIYVLSDGTIDAGALLGLAEQCQLHLAQATASNSPSRRYAIILEKLRHEALREPPAQRNREGMRLPPNTPHETVSAPHYEKRPSACASELDPSSPSKRDNIPETNAETSFSGVDWSMRDWQGEDWLSLDSMVGPQ